ncbi:MAG: DinB family protein [Gemmatimonas sp.]
MKHYGASNMANSWRTVRNNTIQIAEEIPADKYNFRATDDTMTVAQLLAHMATNTLWAVKVHMVDKMNEVGMADFGTFHMTASAAAAQLDNKEKIVAALKANGEEFARGLESMSDEALAEQVGLPPTPKSRFEMLLGLKEHEMHHRGQLMVMERLMGIVPHLTRARQERIAAMAGTAKA